MDTPSIRPQALADLVGHELLAKLRLDWIRVDIARFIRHVPIPPAPLPLPAHHHLNPTAGLVGALSGTGRMSLIIR